MKPLIEVRPARSDTDIPAITDIIRQCNHEDTTVDGVREWMEYNASGRVAKHYVGVDNQDSVIGYGQIIHTASSPANLFYAWIGVNPPFRCQGIGSALWQTLLVAMHEQHADQLVCEVFEKEQEGRLFAEKCRFTLERRLFHSALDLSTFDETPFLPVIASLLSQGIRICTLADLPDDPDTQRKYYELNLEIVRDIPGEYWDFAAYPQFFNERILSTPWFRREGQILALYGDTFAGFASVSLSPETRSAYNVSTGVIEAYRGRKIGLALKVLAARYARQHGARHIVTDNDSRNVPILSINHKMGYQPEPGKLILTRQHNRKE